MSSYIIKMKKNLNNIHSFINIFNKNLYARLKIECKKEKEEKN